MDVKGFIRISLLQHSIYLSDVQDTIPENVEEYEQNSRLNLVANIALFSEFVTALVS